MELELELELELDWTGWNIFVDRIIREALHFTTFKKTYLYRTVIREQIILPYIRLVESIEIVAQDDGIDMT
jgi:hypothetical protein